MDTEIDCDYQVTILLSGVFGVFGREILSVELFQQEHTVIKILKLEAELGK